MNPAFVTNLVLHLLVVLLAGLGAGAVCKRFGLSVLLGYLLVGAVIGEGALGLIANQENELQYLAQAGALLLLFSIGIEFSLRELVRLTRDLFVGGSLQMVLAALPIILAGLALSYSWRAAVLVGAATALSSTVLVYRALEEYGQTATPHGRRAIAVLLFQDIALVPLMLLVPLLTQIETDSPAHVWALLGMKTVFFVVVVTALRWIIARWVIPLLAGLRSTELVVLFAMTVLGSAGLGAYKIGLPPALGAFAAGLILSGNRLTAQIDALVLPYRETFAAVFFVSLGTLMRFGILAEHPLLCLGGLAAVIVWKAAAAAIALRATGLPWRVAAGMGLGLAQMGEFSFLLLSAGLAGALITQTQFNLMIFIALGTLILTPQLLRTGLRWADAWLDLELEGAAAPGVVLPRLRHTVVVGLGPIGAQVASRLETSGSDVCLVDLSPVNLHRYAQEGFRTVAGDATDLEVLRRAGIVQASLVVVTVPQDRTAVQIVRSIRRLNLQGAVLVRCRYQGSIAEIKRSGATAVVSEEAEASAGLLRLLERLETSPPSLP